MVKSIETGKNMIISWKQFRANFSLFSYSFLWSWTLIKGLDFHLKKDKTEITLKSSLTLFKERRKFIKYNQHTFPTDGVDEDSDFWNSVLQRYKSLIWVLLLVINV